MPHDSNPYLWIIGNFYGIMLVYTGMTRLLRFFGVRKGADKVRLDRAEKKEFTTLSYRRFTELSHDDRRRLLEIGAKDFSQKFSGVIKDLSRE